MWSPLNETLRKLDLLPDRLQPSFERYLALLLEYNRQHNLTAIRQPEKIVIEHFCDSLIMLLRWRPRGGESLVDVGPGAGFPSVPLAMVLPDVRITLIESKTKAVRFLQSLKEELHLENVSILSERVEAVGLGEGREIFDTGICRALAPPPVALELVLPLVRVGGLFFLWSSRHFSPQSIEKALPVLGGEIESISAGVLPGSDIERNIVKIRKVRGTPFPYPRPAAKIRKRPL